MRVQIRSKSTQGHYRLGVHIPHEWQEVEITQAQLLILRQDARIELDILDESPDADTILKKVRNNVDESDHEMGD